MSEQEKKFRAFFAIGLPQNLCNELAKIIKFLKEESQGVKWVKPENLHITLRFLGNITMSDANKIAADLAAVLPKIKPFDIKLKSLVKFPSSQNVRAVVIKLESRATLIKLNCLIEDVLQSYVVEKDIHTYVPHLTLGRIKERSILFPENIVLPAFGFVAEKITLFRSNSGVDGSIYTPLICCSLGDLLG